MNAKSLSLILFISILFILNCHGQLSLQLDQNNYLNNLYIKKVMVTHDDQTVWALTGDGKVYYKKAQEIDFTAYLIISDIIVTDFAGYNFNDMYFTHEAKGLMQIKNGVKKELILSDPAITQIRNIAVVLNDTKSDAAIKGDPLYEDFLAIATDQYLYHVFRGTTNMVKYDIYRQPSYDIKDFTITRTSIRGVEFQGKFSTSGRCEWKSDYSVIKTLGHTTFVSVIPDREGYSRITASLFDFQSKIYTSDEAYDFWGTSEGLYVKKYGRCGTASQLRQVISGKQITDIIEVVKLPGLLEQSFIIAASTEGLYYTPLSVYDEFMQVARPDLVNFIPFPDLNGLKINNIATEYTNFAYESPRMLSMCEKVVWAATPLGLKKVYLEFDGTNYQNKVVPGFIYLGIPVEQTEEKVVFELCGSNNLKIISSVPSNFLGPVLIEWYKDGLKVNGLTGIREGVFNEEGTYRAEMTALCEGVKLRSKDYVIRNKAAPEITFNYPTEISVCETEGIQLNTVLKNGYAYRWFKNDLQIPNAIGNSYFATGDGKYRVEVSNCDQNYVTSSSVTLKITALQKPVIGHNQPNYCEGQSLELTVNNPMNYQVKWYFNGQEISEFEGQLSIKPKLNGNYRATFNNGICAKESDPYAFILVISEKPLVSISKSTTKLLCFGETVTLTAETNANSYKWNTGAVTKSIMVTAPGNYSVEVRNNSGCSNISDPVTVEVNNEIILSVPSETKLCTTAGQELILQADPGYSSYTWNGVKGTSNLLKVNAPGNYQVLIEDEKGCTATGIFKVIKWCKEDEISRALVMTNAFSPNGDGINDFWYVKGLENDPSASVLIFNRLGQIVFEGKGDNWFWDGKFRGKDVSEGTYYYRIKSKAHTNYLKGSVTVIR
ncbi:gliding motility-associated C-terminal domain-containing protein [Pedobacter frigoris]|uniref:gliding motility-associated C-terminal domain-containing protein n=1 Tax=Pedobacter frigoris TaxID=2571272 RepID=UPI00293034A7|nr:gliding motility-associated C-terminal domain-containing protein [Pedobacter frigoris]